MKKSFLALASLAAVAVGCQVETMPETPLVESVVYEAVTEAYAPATKTSMNSDLQVLWSEGDQVGVFSGYMYPDAYAVTEGAGTTTAKLELAAPAEMAGAEVTMSGVAAFYPFSDMFLRYNDQGDGVPRFVFYAEQVQKYTEGTFANGSFPMVAVSETNSFAFKNVFGAMKLQFVGTKTVTSVSVSGPNSEPLAGEFQVAVDKGVLTVSPGDMTLPSVKLDCGDGVALNPTTPTDFYLALPPTAFADGFTVSIATAEGDSYTVTADVANEVKRSSVLVMPVVNVDELFSPVSFSAEASASDAELSITLNQEGVVGFVGIFASKDNWDAYGSYFADPETMAMLYGGAYYSQMGMIGCYYPVTEVEELPLSQYGCPQMSGISNMVSGGTTYSVVIIPVFEGEDPSLATAENAIVFEVSTTPLVFGEVVVALPFTEDDVVATYTQVSVEYAPAATNVLFYGWFHEGEELPTEETYADLMWNAPEFDGEFYSIFQESVTPGEEVTLCVLVSDAEGNAELHLVPVAAKAVVFNEALEVTLDEPVYDATNNTVAVLVELPENVAALYFNILTIPSYDDEVDALARLLSSTSLKTVEQAANSVTAYNNWYVVELPLEDGILVAPAKGNAGSDKVNYVHVVVVDNEGKVSHITSSTGVTALNTVKTEGE